MCLNYDSKWESTKKVSETFLSKLSPAMEILHKIQKKRNKKITK